MGGRIAMLVMMIVAMLAVVRVMLEHRRRLHCNRIQYTLLDLQFLDFHFVAAGHLQLVTAAFPGRRHSAA